MIKTLLILALAIALLGGAALSRPSEASFQKMMTAKLEQKAGGGNFIQQVFHKSKVDRYLKDCTYHSRVLWAEVEKDGKVIYVGAFSKWFDRTDDKVSAPEG